MTPVAERSHLDILPDTPLSRPGFRDNAGLCAEARGYRQAALLCRRVPGAPSDLPSRARAAHEQSRRELAPGCAARGAENAAVQIGRLRTTIPQRPRRRPQHLLPAAPSHLSIDPAEVRVEAMTHWQAVVAEL